MGGENPEPVNVDPRCIQEALRMYLQPIKSDDPQLDFYTMYKRETVEYDAEGMNKYNEDLNTTLIFAGLFSAVSSAFVIDVQSRLQPDSTERSEAYLRAILLTLNRATDEDLSGPPSWKGPPTEVITTLDLLYASLLTSLLAAFVAMLGKQWLNRYLRHTGGSTVERCGDRQRKFDGLEKWPFRPFIESLPIMLQIALLLLACGLSRYMWSVNTSAARVIISFTALGLLFYIGIVIAGTWSYECPFQTPASTTLRYLRGSRTTQKLLAGLSPLKVISLIYATRRNTQKLFASLLLPNAASLIYAAWVDTYQGFVSAVHHVHDIAWCPLSWEISLPRIASGIRSAATKVGHQTIILLLRIDRAIGNTKRRLVQMFGCVGLLPITVEDADVQPPIPRSGPGLRVHVRNLEGVRRQNADNARCVCWVLRNITDPEAIDSAIRLAGAIRWFDDDSDLDPPFDLIVSTFEACFDSTKQLYPGMRNRAYFSARATLQINMSARAHSRERASKYPIPATPPSSFRRTDSDLHHVICMLERNIAACRPTFDFPRESTNTHSHLLWVSNLLLDVTRVGPNPILKSYWPYLSAAIANHRPTVANVLLVWYMLLGGHVEEETFWAVDKSDSLETILSHLSTRVTDVIIDGNWAQHLYYLLEFLAAWEKRPACLTPMAYEWCAAISEAAGRVGQRKIPIAQPRTPRYETEHRPKFILKRRLGLRQQEPAFGKGPEYLSSILDEEFSKVGPGCDPLRLGHTFHRTRGIPFENLTPFEYADLLPMALEIGFRLTAPGRTQPTFHLNHTSHHDWIFETAFSNHNDEVIADAVCMWIAGGNHTPPGSPMHYFAKRVERDTPFSPRLRRVSIRAIERIWRSQLEVSPLDTVRLLNRLNVDVDDGVGKRQWGWLLVNVINSQTGLESLSSHYWRFLDKLALPGTLNIDSRSHNVCVARSLEEAEDWEKLEIWMAIEWRSPWTTPMEDVGRVTLKLLSQRPSALQRFEALCETDIRWMSQQVELRWICDQARTEQSPSESPPPQPTHVQSLVLLPFEGDDTF